MRPRLLFADQDRAYPPLSEGLSDVERDLGLAPVLAAMAGPDAYLLDVARRVLLADPLRARQVAYRHGILADCLRHPETVRELYDLSRTAMDAKYRVHAWISNSHPAGILRSSVAILSDLLDHLELLHAFAIAHRGEFTSVGLTTLLGSIERDLDEDYLAQVRRTIGQLQFAKGVVLTAGLGPGCSGVDYRLIDAAPAQWWMRLNRYLPQRGYVYRLPPRDEHGGITMDRIRDHGINSVANAAAQSTDHVLTFFRRLSFEIGFYLGCVQLDQALNRCEVPRCLPTTSPRAWTCRGLVDIGLALRTQRAPIGTDLDADGKRLIMITGANQGGKSTCLRSLGLAQIMVDAGLFVAAQSYRGWPSRGVLTHYRREEDAALVHGKFDDELARMSHVVDQLGSGSLLLLDESFASTNEREGSQIARDVVESLVAAGIRVCFVTHLYSLARGLADRGDARYLFLRAAREAHGRRSFQLVPGAPESTSYAWDVYEQVFAAPDAAGSPGGGYDGAGSAAAL